MGGAIKPKRFLLTIRAKGLLLLQKSCVPEFGRKNPEKYVKQMESTGITLEKVRHRIPSTTQAIPMRRKAVPAAAVTAAHKMWSQGKTHKPAA